jgi:multiple sugar transport system ATP-binding protein
MVPLPSLGNRRASGKHRLELALEPLPSRYVDKDIIFGIRPEHISNEPKEGSSLPVTLTVDIAEPMGSESLVYLKAGTGNLIARIHGEHLFRLGE